MHSVEIKKLDLNFGSVSVLHNLDLNVHKGEFLVLLGSSGCGKSTLLNCIAGLLDITDGQILINGTNRWSCGHVRARAGAGLRGEPHRGLRERNGGELRGALSYYSQTNVFFCNI